MKFDLGFGNSVAVREAFLRTTNNEMIVFTSDRLSSFDYPAHEGDPEVIAITKAVIERQVGNRYKHILLTNGATGAVTITLRTYSYMYRYAFTREAPWYLRYPSMIKASGMEHKTAPASVDFTNCGVLLLDLPSNPIGSMESVDSLNWPVVLDGVYLNRVYTSLDFALPNHEVLIGSYSKLLGLNGLRVGWIATNNTELYEKLRPMVIAEYCGLDTATSILIKQLLRDFYWPKFEQLAQSGLNDNRLEFSKLERYFEQEIKPIGMFHYTQMDKKAQKLFEKSGVSWTKGSLVGTSDKFARFNIGQDRTLIKNAVKEILKNDKAKK